MNSLIQRLLLGLILLSVNPISANDKPYDNTFFGHLNFELQNIDNDQEAGFTPKDHFTRIGIKGYVENDDEVQAYYHIEYAFRLTSRDRKDINKRNMGLGVRGWFGDFFIGRNDLPSKKIQQKVDLFSDMDPDVLFAFDGDRRQADIVMYSSPTINHFKGFVALKSDKDKPSLDVKAWSASLLYQRYQWGLGYSHNHDIRIEGLTSQRATAQYRYKNWQWGALIQESDLRGDAEWGYLLSAKYQVNKNSYKVQFTESDIWKLGIVKSIRYAEQLSIGWDHVLNKNLSAYVRTTWSTTGTTQDDDRLFGVGMILKI